MHRLIHTFLLNHHEKRPAQTIIITKMDKIDVKLKSSDILNVPALFMFYLPLHTSLNNITALIFVGICASFLKQFPLTII